MPSERDIDNYINEIEEKNQIYIEEELEYAKKCHNLEEQLGCPLEVVFKMIGSYIILDGEPCYVMGILKDGDKLCIHYSKCYEAYDDIEPLSNYGKTFWIYDEDRSE